MRRLCRGRLKKRLRKLDIAPKGGDTILNMFQFFGKEPQPRKGEQPRKPGGRDFELLKEEIRKEQAEATRQKNQAKIHTVSGYAERSLDEIAKGASELHAAATQENVKQSFRDAADAASDVLDEVEKEEGKHEHSK